MQAWIIRVLPAELGWTLDLVGLKMEAQKFQTLEAAIAAGWALARREKAELHIHRRDSDVRLLDARVDDDARTP